MNTFHIHRSADKQFYVTIVGRNGRVLYTSQLFKRKLNAMKGIIAVGGKEARVKDKTMKK
jgi:uncharacterized protein YegP (UPF0339 family)